MSLEGKLAIKPNGRKTIKALVNKSRSFRKARLWRRIQFVLSKPLWAVATVHPPLRLSSGNSRSNCANCQTGLGSSILIFYLVCHGWYAEMKFSSLNGLDLLSNS